MSRELRNALEQEFKNVIVARLRYGDLFANLSNGIVLIERKTPNDLLASIRDLRAFDQVRGMTETARFAFLAIHGSLTYNRDDQVIADGRLTGWNGQSVRMALVALQAAGAIVVQTHSGGYVELVKHLLAWCAKADSGWAMRKTVHWLPRDAKRDFLAQLPGVGSERVDALIQHHGDRALVELLRDASTPSGDLPRLWGTATVGKIREFLGLRGTQRISIQEKTDWIEEID